ncbi:type II toxin-antitoxin system VapC family toxin [Chitinilyticum litopenaei]|uniref:Type II toxin-antitoxin system VapC family toxin n=2 Tax=Chitinilyticum piscinae TaxID=2866724 RepID=A0A8J7FPP1_9NEIS|nr:type II toxin-antitoxin system VapC family toxin [Chitinilyticum piscinae]
MITYMLDTCICSFIMRERPESVLQRLAHEVSRKNQIVISAITYAEMRYGQIGKKASPKHSVLVDEFIRRIDGILPWDSHAVDATVSVKQSLAAAGTPIGENDTAIAGHAIANDCILVTNNLREFSRVQSLKVEDWVH